MKNILFLLLMAAFFTSCEKVLDLKYKSNQSKIIIEGNITNQPGPYFVKIKKSISLTDVGTYPAIDNATVTISDNAGNSERLTPLGDGTYRTSTIVGTEGRTYTLTVLAESQTYTAQSSMPLRVRFDSIKLEIAKVTGENEYSLIPVYTDPLIKGNNYRFVMSLNSKLVNQHFIQNDEVRNGVVNSSRLDYNDDDAKFKSGDLISLQMQCIDKNVAVYYTTLALMADSGPGGGTTPNNPVNNFSNGALGLFSAYTTETRSITIP